MVQVRKLSCVLSSGRRVQVFSEKSVERRNGFLCLDRVVRSFVRDVDSGKELELEPGCVFQWSRVVREHGW